MLSNTQNMKKITGINQYRSFRIYFEKIMQELIYKELCIIYWKKQTLAAKDLES